MLVSHGASLVKVAGRRYSVEIQYIKALKAPSIPCSLFNVSGD